MLELHCSRCGRKNHITDDCYAKTDSKGIAIPTYSPLGSEEYKNIELMYTISVPILSYAKCIRCGREGHNKNHCRFETHIEGHILIRDYSCCKIL